MASRILQLFALWITVVGIVHCCPKLCSCLDKYYHQFSDCAYKDLLVVPVGLPSNTTTLSLPANKITFLKAKTFINVTQVTTLWLAHNQIVTVDKDTFAPLILLRNLDVSHNKIVDFPWEDLYNLTALQLLKLNHNEMTNLPRDAFSTLKDLKSLRINNNRFTTIVQGTFTALSSMSHLQIFNNPFTCSCSLQWLRDWITTTRIAVPEKENILCETPEQLKGARVTKLECKAPVATITYQPNNTSIPPNTTADANMADMAEVLKDIRKLRADFEKEIKNLRADFGAKLDNIETRLTTMTRLATVEDKMTIVQREVTSNTNRTEEAEAWAET